MGSGGAGAAPSGAGAPQSGAGTGAVAGGGGMTGDTVTFASVAAIVQATCGATNCHGRRERPTLTNANLTTLYTTLTGTAVQQCGSDHLAKANDKANSALLELVQHQCGTFVMPDGCTDNPCIDAASLATITAWIDAGAPGP